LQWRQGHGFRRDAQRIEHVDTAAEHDGEHACKACCLAAHQQLAQHRDRQQEPVEQKAGLVLLQEPAQALHGGKQREQQRQPIITGKRRKRDESPREQR